MSFPNTRRSPLRAKNSGLFFSIIIGFIVYTACSLNIHLYQAVKMLYFGCLGRNNKLVFNKGDFYAQQVSLNSLACPKGVKYKRIPNEQAVHTEIRSPK